MMRDALLALGLVLSTAHQLRLSSLPIGPGELLLATWVALALTYEVRRLGPPSSAALAKLLTFWVAFTFAQSIGLLNGLATEDFRDTASCLHDIVAYLLMASVSCFMVVLPDAEHRLRRTTWIAVIAGGACILVLVAAGLGVFSIPGIDPWWNGWNRLRGWSENPNQFGLLCSALVLLSLHLGETATGSGARLAALLAAVPSFIGGILSGSDSFVLIILIAGPMFCGLKLWTWLFSVGSRLSLRAALGCLAFLAIPAFVVSAAPMVPTIVDKAGKFAVETMEKNEQAENRFKLWREAIEVGTRAGMLGLGPGPHLVNKQWKRPPPDKFEAHFVVLDLFVQGGILASLCYIWLVATTFFAAHKSQLIGLMTLVLSLFVFSMFHHFIIRHPIFWFSISLCLVAAESIRKRNAYEAGSA